MYDGLGVVLAHIVQQMVNEAGPLHAGHINLGSQLQDNLWPCADAN